MSLNESRGRGVILAWGREVGVNINELMSRAYDERIHSVSKQLSIA